MSSQAPRVVSTIVCDEVRREDNGKLLVIGMYLGSILVPCVPFVLPRLSFFLTWRTNGFLPSGDFRLSGPSRRAVGQFGMRSEGQPESVIPTFYTTFTLENTLLAEAGSYTLSFKSCGRARFRPVSSFDVGLKK